MIWAGHIARVGLLSTYSFRSEMLKRKDHLVNLGVLGRIRQWILKEWMGECGLNSSGSR
jgi:hypothetical protein